MFPNHRSVRPLAVLPNLKVRNPCTKTTVFFFPRKKKQKTKTKIWPCLRGHVRISLRKTRNLRSAARSREPLRRASRTCLLMSCSLDNNRQPFAPFLRRFYRKSRSVRLRFSVGNGMGWDVDPSFYIVKRRRFSSFCSLTSPRGAPFSGSFISILITCVYCNLYGISIIFMFKRYRINICNICAI